MSVVADLLAEVRTALTERGIATPVVAGKDFPAREANALVGRFSVVLQGGSYTAMDRSDRDQKFMRLQSIDVHVWAAAPAQSDADTQSLADAEAARALADEFMMALYRTHYGAIAFPAAFRQTQGAATVEYGCEVVVSPTVRMAVSDDHYDLVSVPAPGFTAVMRFPSGDHVAVPSP